jgi:branched-chain amino acid transport system substrate-binding protein
MTSAQDPVVLTRQMKAAGQSRILFIAAAYNKLYYETYLTVIASGVTIAGPVYYNTLKEIDYKSIRTLARKPGYDAVMIVASPLDTGTIAQKLSLEGLSKPLYLSGWAGSNDVITYGGSAVEGAILVHQVDIDQTKDSPLAVSYRKVFGIDASYGAIETWDSMMLLAEVLRNAKGNYGQLYQELRNIREFTGTSEKILMDSFGDAQRPLYMKQIKNGAFVVMGKVE